MNTKILLFCLIFLSGAGAQEIYFGKEIDTLISVKKAFWKKVYSQIDSSKTVIYDKKTLHTYAIVKNSDVKNVFDSLKMANKYNGNIMMKQGRKEFIREAIYRAQKYSYITDTLVMHGIDQDLRWLPVLESGYLDTMVSNQNARGIWQFIPSTAKKFGLSDVDITIPQKSTSAFVSYFSLLYNKFNDYALAITAYHHGENGISVKLEKRNAESLHEILPDLGFESANYYAKYLSIIDIAHELTSE